MLANGRMFIATPYVAGTLERGDEEQLIINRQEVDCTTFVEYVLALSLSSEAEEFAAHLQRIRYRDGKIDGYTSRLHYISDWINNGVRNGFLEDVTAANSTYTQKLNVSYMSTNPHLYKQLARSPANVAKMKVYEQTLMGQEIHWLPQDKLPTTGMPWIKDGDIIAIATNTPGLDIAHMGIAAYHNGELHLLHASSAQGKVILDALPLNSLLERNSRWTGIRVVRMKNSPSDE